MNFHVCTTCIAIFTVRFTGVYDQTIVHSIILMMAFHRIDLLDNLVKNIISAQSEKKLLYQLLVEVYACQPRAQKKEMKTNKQSNEEKKHIHARTHARTSIYISVVM